MDFEMIDSHCHLDDSRFGDAAARKQVLDQAAQAGVTEIIVPGVNPKDWRNLLTFVQNGHESVRLHACLGIHPQALPDLSDEEIADALTQLETASSPQMVGIGECGLDGPTGKKNGGTMERQLEVLAQHLNIAERLEVPVVLHCLRAHDPLLRCLRRQGLIKGGYILHSFSGSPQQVEAYRELGAWFGIAGPVTYRNARRPLNTAKAIPLERLLVETDAPDQTPEPHRGSLNQPSFLPQIVNILAHLRAVSSEEIARQTTLNARRCFQLDPKNRRKTALREKGPSDDKT